MKKFLTALLAFSAGLMLQASAESAVMKNPFFALDTAVRNLAELDSVRELGYAGIGWMAQDPPRLQAAADQLRQRSLNLFALYLGATIHKDKFETDPRLEGMMTALKGHNTILWLHLGSPDFPISSTNGDAVAVAGLRHVADLAAAQDLRVALYPHTGEWGERIQDAMRLAKKVDRKNLGVTFNLCHCLMVGDEAKIPELLTEAAPYLFLVTINGADTGAARTSWGRLIRPLDEGSFDVGTVLKQLKALKYEGPIGLQGYGVNLPPKTNLTRSMNAWKKLSTLDP